MFLASRWASCVDVAQNGRVGGLRGGPWEGIKGRYSNSKFIFKLKFGGHGSHLADHGRHLVANKASKAKIIPPRTQVGPILALFSENVDFPLCFWHRGGLRALTSHKMGGSAACAGAPGRG